MHAAVFPAIARASVAALPESVGDESEASCFYHPASRAAVPCEECGRFLCRLCDLEVDGRHVCPTCFQTQTTVTRRTMHDTIALAIATLPALFVWPVIITAPAALYVTIRRWRAPGSLVPRTRVRFYLAAALALSEMAGIGFLIWTILRIPARA